MFVRGPLRDPLGAGHGDEENWRASHGGGPGYGIAVDLVEVLRWIEQYCGQAQTAASPGGIPVVTVEQIRDAYQRRMSEGPPPRE